MTLRCFWLEPTGDVVVTWSVRHGDHRMEGAFAPEPARYEPREGWEHGLLVNASDRWGDVDWPAVCAECGQTLDYDADDVSRSMGARRHYRRTDTGEVRDSPRAFGPGAMWDAYWMPEPYRGDDGRCLVAVTPDGYEWMIDSRASNCTRPDDDVHKCWVREGEPPNITAGKQGNTCSAGAGSIATPGYHGFLRNGRFT